MTRRYHLPLRAASGAERQFRVELEKTVFSSGRAWSRSNHCGSVRVSRAVGLAVGAACPLAYAPRARLRRSVILGSWLHCRTRLRNERHSPGAEENHRKGSPRAWLSRWPHPLGSVGEPNREILRKCDLFSRNPHLAVGRVGISELTRVVKVPRELDVAAGVDWLQRGRANCGELSGIPEVRWICSGAGRRGSRRSTVGDGSVNPRQADSESQFRS